MTATLEQLQGWLERGWAIFPCHNMADGSCSCGRVDCDSPGKHPRTHNGVKGASKDLDQIRRWSETWPRANWAVATGAPSQLVVIDLDVGPGKDGYGAFDAYLERENVRISNTFVVRTGGGGRHFYFGTAGQEVKNRVNWLPGVDVRGDGGYVLLPHSNHASGSSYAVEADHWLATIDDRMLRSIRAGNTGVGTWSAPSNLLAGVGEGERDDHLFRLACYFRRALRDDREAVTMLVLEAARNCTPPFPEQDALVKVESAFSQDHTDYVDLNQVPFAAPQGELYEFLSDLDPDMVDSIEKWVRNAKIRTFGQRVLREERVAKYGDAASLDGDEFMFGEVASDVPIWGEGDDLLWAEQGGLMIASDQGLGKSLTAQQIIASRLGVGPANLLDLPIRELAAGKVVVYLALDRPRQIARSMARLFRTAEEKAIAKAQLRVWTKPMPIDILGDPFAFADWIQDEFGDNVGDLIIDSVKDLTPANLSNGEVGQALDMAWKECRARGMSTLILHHERKTGNEESRANRQPSLDHIYGSVWLTSGMDSIVHISGKQGENLVQYTHLKAIINMLDPIDAVHDQDNGRTSVLALAKNANRADSKAEQIYQVVEYGTRESGTVMTAADVVSRSGIAKATVDRHLKRLVEEGRVVRASEYDKATGTPATYCVAETHPPAPPATRLDFEPE